MAPEHYEINEHYIFCQYLCLFSINLFVNDSKILTTSDKQTEKHIFIFVAEKNQSGDKIWRSIQQHALLMHMYVNNSQRKFLQATEGKAIQNSQSRCKLLSTLVYSTMYFNPCMPYTQWLVHQRASLTIGLFQFLDFKHD